MQPKKVTDSGVRCLPPTSWLVTVAPRRPTQTGLVRGDYTNRINLCYLALRSLDIPPKAQGCWTILEGSISRRRRFRDSTAGNTVPSAPPCGIQCVFSLQSKPILPPLASPVSHSSPASCSAPLLYWEPVSS